MQLPFWKFPFGSNFGVKLLDSGDSAENDALSIYYISDFNEIFAH